MIRRSRPARHGHGFRRQQRLNARRLRLALLLYFALALLAGRATGLAFLHLGDPEAYYYVAQEGLASDYAGEPHREWFGYVNQVTLAVLLLAWVEYRRMRRRGDELILSLVDARPLKELQLQNTGAEMAIAARQRKPRMWIVESPELNAFACASADGRSSIVLTRGLLERLDRDEIQAVVAHEMGHIRNGDTRLLTLLLGLGRGFHLISALALGPLRIFLYAAMSPDPEPQDPSADASGPGPHEAPSIWDRPWTVREILLALLATPLAALALVVGGVVFSLMLLLVFGVFIWLFPWFIGAYALVQLAREHVPAADAWLARYVFGPDSRAGAVFALVPVGLIFGPAILVLGILVPTVLALMRLAVSRNREYQADATAVELTRNPDALRRALEKIRDGERAANATGLPPALSPLTIAPLPRRWPGWSGLRRLAGLISSHPPIEERIRRLADMGFTPAGGPR